MTLYKTHLLVGIDDPVLEQMAKARTDSAWLAEALKVFFEHFKPEELGENDQERKTVSTYADIPKWAEAYLDRAGGRKSRFIRAAAWFYLGRLSNQFDMKVLIEQLKEFGMLDRAPVKAITSEEKDLIEMFVNQF